MAERVEQRQVPGVGQLTERPRSVEVMVVLLLVPAAFIAGWRARRGFGRLIGYY
jgi:hypothetical protein